MSMFKLLFDYTCKMSVKLLLLLLSLACVTVQNSDEKGSNQLQTSRTHLGMSFDDPRILNRKAACPPDCPSDCKDAYDQGGLADGPYIIYISTDDMRPLIVYCDMTTSGGGWTVFQKRINGALDFYRDWVEYVEGFGELNAEYWLGLNNLHLLLAQKNYRLRVDLVDFNGSTPYAEYNVFTIGSPLNKYALGINRFLGGTAGDALKYPSTSLDLTNLKFSTRDQDNDITSGSCAVTYHGAWWYNACGVANLNGMYTTDTTSNTYTNIHWYTWRSGYYAMKSTAMKFRPL